MKPVAHANPLSILVVDDHADGAESLAAVLRLEGHQVFVALQPDNALRMAQLHPPDVVLMDLRLPDMNGYDLAQRLRALLPQAPVFAAVTGLGQPQDYARSWQAGFDRHFVKPVDLYVLADYLMDCAAIRTQLMTGNQVSPLAADMSGIGGPPMFDLTTSIIHHDLYRVIPCCLCGAEWEEQWVSVALLVQGERQLGNLCPRCLASTPKARASRVRELGQRLASMHSQVRDCLTQPLPQVPPPGNVEALQAQAALMRERTDRMRAATQQWRETNAQYWGVTRQSLAHLAKLHQELHRLLSETRRLGAPVSEGQELAVLENSLVRLDHWPTKLAEVIQLERNCYRQQFTDPTEHAIRRAVDDRYYHFLAQSA
jgi:CheY-like chemotaxis protein